MSHQLDRHKLTQQHLQDAMDRLQVSRNDVAQLQTDVAHLRETETRLEARTATLLDANRDKTREIADLQGEVKIIAAENRDLKKEIAQTKTTLDDLVRRLQKVEDGKQS